MMAVVKVVYVICVGMHYSIFIESWPLNQWTEIFQKIFRNSIFLFKPKSTYLGVSHFSQLCKKYFYIDITSSTIFKNNRDSSLFFVYRNILLRSSTFFLNYGDNFGGIASKNRN